MDRYSVSDIIQLWASQKLTDTDAAKKIAYQIDRDIYYKQTNEIIDNDITATHLAALLRSLARRDKDGTIL